MTMLKKSEMLSKSSYPLLEYTSSVEQRKIQHGDVETRIERLNQQIEQLSLSNARLFRNNRMLKLDTDKIVQEKTKEINQALQASIEQNIRLQRANRLLQQEIDSKSEELNRYKQEHVQQMKHVGPEYEYLVQVVHLLYRQLSDKPKCEKTCCFTDQSITPHHLCRPIIHSSAGSKMTTVFENENSSQLKESISILSHDRDALYELLQNKEQDNETLRYELKVKDDIVKQLEQDFEKMELQVSDLQKEWFSPDSTFSEIHSFPPVPTSI